MRTHRHQGFTLAELLVVIALISITAAVAIPTAAPSADQRLDAAAQEVIDALRYARIEAMRTGAFYGVDFSVDAATGTRRVRVFRTDTASPTIPVYDVMHPLDKKLYDRQLISGSATAGVSISAATLYYQSGAATPVARDWAAFDAAGTPEYYPDANNYAAYSAAPYVSAVTLSYSGQLGAGAARPADGPRDAQLSDAAMAPDPCLQRQRQRGLSYVEVLVAVVILAVCLAPMVDALRNGVRAAGIQSDYTINQQRLKTRFEAVLANNFATLDAAAMLAGNSPAATVAAYTDAAGTTDRLLVTLYRYDGSAPTGLDTGLLWVKAAIEGSNLQLNTLKSRW